MKLISILILSIFTILPFYADSQYLTEDKEIEKGRSALRDRLFYGGNFGLSFGSVTYIEFSPIIGYKITDKFSAGIGVNYTYYKEELIYNVNGTINSWDYVSKVYGGKTFAEYMLLDKMQEKFNLNIGSIIAHTEIEQLNVETYTHDQFGYYENGRKWITSVLVGAGIRQPMGERSSVNLLILYNLTEELFTPYSNPVIRINFNF